MSSFEDIRARLVAARTADEVDACVALARTHASAPTEEVLGALRELALARVTAEQRLLEAVRTRQELLAGISHDLRNPLNTFAISTGILKDDIERGAVDPARTRTLADRMARAIERMQRLTEDLVDAGHADAGTMDLDRQSLALAKVVEDVVAGPLLAVVEERRATVGVGSLDASIRVLADRRRVEQLLLRGTAHLLRHAGDRVRVLVELARVGDAAALTVRVEGPVARASDEGRVPLAVVLARGISRQHGGTFALGTDALPSFTVTLPALT